MVGTKVNWDPERVKQALDTELSVEGINAHRKITARKLREAAPVCADAIAHLATWSTNESVRLKAASYVLDRVYGKVGNDGLKVKEDEGSLESVVNDLYEDAEV